VVVAVNVEDLLALHTEDTKSLSARAPPKRACVCYPERTHSVRPAEC
jgi:hypothetical protein